jgi:hypothetical protein
MKHSSNDDECFKKLYWHVLVCEEANIVGGRILVESINIDTIVLCEQIPRRGRSSPLQSFGKGIQGCQPRGRR